MAVLALAHGPALAIGTWEMGGALLSQKCQMIHFQEAKLKAELFMSFFEGNESICFFLLHCPSFSVFVHPIVPLVFTYSSFMPNALMSFLEKAT